MIFGKKCLHLFVSTIAIESKIRDLCMTISSVQLDVIMYSTVVLEQFGMHILTCLTFYFLNNLYFPYIFYCKIIGMFVDNLIVILIYRVVLNVYYF